MQAAGDRKPLQNPWWKAILVARIGSNYDMILEPPERLSPFLDSKFITFDHGNLTQPVFTEKSNFPGIGQLGKVVLNLLG